MSSTYSPYTPRIIDGQACIWLQGYGYHPAKQVKDIELGDTIVFNYGATGKVVGIGRQTAKTRVIVISENGKEYEKRLKHTGYKAVA